jgi:hypothetical protein
LDGNEVRSVPRVEWLAVGVATVIGAILRCFAVVRVGQHIDEAASAMAAVCTATSGVPVFPSGVLYLQGASLSYLLAPALRLGLDPVSAWVRVVPLIPGCLSVPLAWWVGRRLGLGWVALLAAAWLALDPLSVEWSAHLRPYALIQLTTLVAVGAFASIRDGARWPIVLFWAAMLLGVFTHIGIALLLPALALATVLTAPRDLTRWVALVGAGAPPLVLLAINKLYGVSSAGDAPPAAMSFVGNHLVSTSTLWSPDFHGWTQLYASQGLAGVVAMSVGVLLATAAARDRWVLAIYGIPVLLVSALTTEQMGRYLLLIAAFGWMVVALAVERVVTWHWPDPASPWGRRILAAIAVGIAVMNASGLYSLFRKPAVDPDYGKMFEVVVERRQPDEPVIAAMTTAVWLRQGGSGAGLWFLAGPASGPRAKRYTRPKMAGRVDYWAGVPAITSAAQLCNALKGAHRPWVIMDEGRLQYAFDGAMGDVLRGATRVVWRGTGGGLVHHAEDVTRWSPTARRVCVIPSSVPVAPDAIRDGKSMVPIVPLVLPH